MKIGPLYIGWRPLNEATRIELDLVPWPAGWESFRIEWNGWPVNVSLTIGVRPREGVEL